MAVVFVMGTMSNVGKSLIAAGLCRVFAQDGYSVAPFKSQNMANNSYVTPDGLEMGRAQVVQAECSRAVPDVSMNPVLLKPTDDCGSQVIVNGVPVRNMRASEYFEYKKELVPVIMEAYDKLKSRYDIIVVEGAGSPAEINLKNNDIVNMGLADMIDAPVLLVGDIDRGGVFAQLIGTLDLLEDYERARVKGLIINKFRGDVSLLEPGIRMLAERSDCPVVGVVPFSDIRIDDEDSLSDRLNKRVVKSFDIAVVRCAHLANFTDLDVFDQIDDVSVRYVDKPEEIGNADLMVIPGSKNTIADMRILQSSGIADAICDFAEGGRPVIGICGGFQMLGSLIEDPEGVEGGGSVEGLGLLPIKTVIDAKKMRRIIEGSVTDPSGVLTALKGCRIKGYEIHMGTTECLEELSEFTSDSTGYCRENVYGTYIHGLFDTKEACTGIVGAIASANGKTIDSSNVSDQSAHKEMQYDHLADILRKSLDIPAIYEMMGLEGPRVSE